jgi:hypothetical protein
METFARRAERADYFRPIISGGQPDSEIELIRGRYRLEYSYDKMLALTGDETHRLIARGPNEELEQLVFDAYKKLENRCEVIVVDAPTSPACCRWSTSSRTRGWRTSMAARCSSPRGGSPSIASASSLAKATEAGRHL